MPSLKSIMERSCRAHPRDVDVTSDGAPADDAWVDDTTVDDSSVDGTTAADESVDGASGRDEHSDLLVDHTPGNAIVICTDVLSSNESQIEQNAGSARMAKMRSKIPKSACNGITGMIVTALTDLKCHKGVSVVAIKKFMESQYGFDWSRKKTIVRRLLEAGLKSGLFVRKSGRGFNGRFRLGVDKKQLAKERQQEKQRRDRERARKRYREQQQKEKEYNSKRIQRAREKAKKTAEDTKRRIMEAREKVKRLTAEKKAEEQKKWETWRKKLTIMFK